MRCYIKSVLQRNFRKGGANLRVCHGSAHGFASFSKISLEKQFQLFFLVVVLLTGCSHRPAAALDLPIFFTCDTHGRLEPCGCFTGQYGGLTRLKTVLDAEAAPGALRLDIGNSAAGAEDYDFVEYRYMLQAFAAMHYDAINIGAREAQFTAAQLRELKKTSTTPILCANLTDKTTGAQIFDSYRIIERNGQRIALIGAVDPRAAQTPGAGLIIGNMENAIEKSLTAVRGKADLVILLAFTDETTLAELAHRFYECQVILGGNVSQPAQQLQKENRSLIYFVTNEARALGILHLRLAKGAPLQVAGKNFCRR